MENMKLRSIWCRFFLRSCVFQTVTSWELFITVILVSATALLSPIFLVSNQVYSSNRLTLETSQRRIVSLLTYIRQSIYGQFS